MVGERESGRVWFEFVRSSWLNKQTTRVLGTRDTFSAPRSKMSRAEIGIGRGLPLCKEMGEN